MRIPERDVTYIVLSVYLLTLIHRYPLSRSSPRHEVNLIQLKTFELELDFAQYIRIHYSTLMCGLKILAAPPPYIHVLSTG